MKVFLFTFLLLLFQEEFSKTDGIRKILEVLANRIEEDSSEANGKIIEVILSIVGNCTCRSENCANQVNLSLLNCC